MDANQVVDERDISSPINFVLEPRDIIKRLSDALHYATTSKDVGDRLKEQGSEPGTESSEEFDRFMAADRAMETALVTALKLPKE